MIPTASRTTPRCTIMPPLARPTRPRHNPTWRAWAARTERTRARAAVAAAMAPRPNPIRVPKPRRPKATQSTTVPTPIHTGIARRCHSTGPLILRQLSTGATAMRKSNGVEERRAHVHLLLCRRLVEERVQGAEQDHEGEADEEQVVEKERTLA